MNHAVVRQTRYTVSKSDWRGQGYGARRGGGQVHGEELRRSSRLVQAVSARDGREAKRAQASGETVFAAVSQLRALRCMSRIDSAGRAKGVPQLRAHQADRTVRASKGHRGPQECVLHMPERQGELVPMRGVWAAVHSPRIEPYPLPSMPGVCSSQLRPMRIAVQPTPATRAHLEVLFGTVSGCRGRGTADCGSSSRADGSASGVRRGIPRVCLLWRVAAGIPGARSRRWGRTQATGRDGRRRFLQLAEAAGLSGRIPHSLPQLQFRTPIERGRLPSPILASSSWHTTYSPQVRLAG